MWFKRSNHRVRRFKQGAQFAEFFQPIALQAYKRTCQATDLVVTRGEYGCMYRNRLLRGRQRLVLDGKRMERANDPDQQHQPEQQATDGEEQHCRQQPEMELRDNGQRLASGPLYNDGPAGVRDGYSAEEPVLAIGSQTQA